jgi:hypothetical protein
VALENVNADVVRARRIELVNEENEIRALLETRPGGAAWLDFLPDGETPRTSVGVNQFGTAVIALRDTTGSIRVRAVVNPSEDMVGIVLQDPAGRELAFLQVREDQYAEVGVIEAGGDRRVESLKNEF